MKNFVIALLTFSAATSAQAGLQLGDRPISRSEVIATVRKQFAQMDANGNGTISPDEFLTYRSYQAELPDGGRGLTKIGRSWFERSDEDGDGRITQREALGRPLELFGIADNNGDGVASLDEQSLAALFVK